MNSITLAKFKPINEWKEDSTSALWPNGIDEKPAHMYVIDVSTGDRYLNQGHKQVAIQCAAVVFAIIIFYPIVAAGVVIFRTIKILSFYEYWEYIPGKNSFKNRSIAYGKDFLYILISPFIVPLLTLSAIYGIFRPYDGRKLFASLESAFLDGHPLCTCYQPDAKSHLFGGEITDPKAW